MQYPDTTFTNANQEDIHKFIRVCTTLLKFLSKAKLVDREIIYRHENGDTAHFRREDGLCSLADKTMDAMYPRGAWGVRSPLRYGFERWEKFSGNYSYPIPPTSDLSRSYDSSDSSRVYERESHWEGQQLQLRKELLIKIIQCAKSFIRE